MRNVRRERRIWKLHVLLSLLLEGGVSRISPRSRHFWAYIPGDEVGASTYAQEMYFVPGFVSLVSDLTDPNGNAPIAEISDNEYFERKGIDSTHPLQVPQYLHDVSTRLDTSAPATHFSVAWTCPCEVEALIRGA